MDGMTDQLLGMIDEMIADDRLFKAGAKLMKKTVDALVEEGFTRQEAIEITSRQGSLVKSTR